MRSLIVSMFRYNFYLKYWHYFMILCVILR
jgi:hypothetical protein